MGRKEPFRKTPVFWSAQQGKQLRYCGHATDYEEVLVQGDLQELSFSAYYVKDDKVLAVSSVMQDPVVSKAAELYQAGKMLSATDIRYIRLLEMFTITFMLICGLTGMESLFWMPKCNIS